jgi:hypothetical protein
VRVIPIKVNLEFYSRVILVGNGSNKEGLSTLSDEKII